MVVDIVMASLLHRAMGSGTDMFAMEYKVNFWKKNYRSPHYFIEVIAINNIVKIK
jgi:hypothetical protein